MTWWVRWEPGTADASLLMQKTCMHCSVVTHDMLSIPVFSNSCMKFLLKGLGPSHSLDSPAEKNISVLYQVGSAYRLGAITLLDNKICVVRTHLLVIRLLL